MALQFAPVRTNVRGVSQRNVPSSLNHDPEAVRWAVKRSGLTQAHLARALEISEGHMSEILGGTRSARQALLIRLAAELNCPVVILESKQAVAS